jgi:hypothetical protein
MPEKYEVEFGLTFSKVKETGTVPGMVASIKYLDMDYADAVKAEACALPMLQALFALGQEQAGG